MIICPNCTTSYDVDPAKLGPHGRTVRCARCKETWLALAEDAMALEMADADAGGRAGLAPNDAHDWQDDAPQMDSPSISAAADDGQHDDLGVHPDWSADEDERRQKPASKLGRLFGFLKLPASLPALPSLPVPQFARHYLTLPVACVAMAALSVAIVIWRTDVVRLMPQTAAFFKTVGLGVNLRGLAIEDVKVTSETVDGKPVFVIEGVVADVSRKQLQVPRLRFVVHDDKGTEIYAWTSVIEQSTLQPGERTPFTSRLASPPADARSIAVRFFSKRDIGA